jgi:hypothetical protein
VGNPDLLGQMITSFANAMRSASADQADGADRSERSDALCAAATGH